MMGIGWIARVIQIARIARVRAPAPLVGVGWIKRIARIARVRAPAPLLLVGALLAGPGAIAAQVPDTEFDEMYEDIVSYIMDPGNHPDLAHGVVRIEYGDAKAYYPAWVYARERLPGFSATQDELSIATEMHKRFEESFEKVEASPFLIFKDMDIAMDVAIGIEGIFRAYEHNPQDEYLDLIRRYLELAKPIAKRPLLLSSYHVEPYGPVTVIAGGAWFYLEYAFATGPDDPYYDEYKRIGLSIIEKIDRKFFIPGQSKYKYSSRHGYDFTYVYNNTVMVQALVRAYVVTGERRYYDRARSVMETIDRELYHPGYKGYLAADDCCRYFKRYEKIGPHYNNEYMAMSAHNYMIYAYFALYEAGGFEDDELLEKAARCMRFERDWLWDKKGKIQHHIERGVLSPEDEYCMGCNYQLLFHVVQYKALLMKEPVLGLKVLGADIE